MRRRLLIRKHLAVKNELTIFQCHDFETCRVPAHGRALLTPLSALDFALQPAQGLVEYGLILALVAVVSIAGLLVFGAAVGEMMSTLSSTVSLNV
jgi:Flp pilus assembly pilin Flp